MVQLNPFYTEKGNFSPTPLARFRLTAPKQNSAYFHFDETRHPQYRYHIGHVGFLLSQNSGSFA